MNKNIISILVPRAAKRDPKPFQDPPQVPFKGFLYGFL